MNSIGPLVAPHPVGRFLEPLLFKICQSDYKKKLFIQKTRYHAVRKEFQAYETNLLDTISYKCMKPAEYDRISFFVFGKAELFVYYQMIT